MQTLIKNIKNIYTRAMSKDTTLAGQSTFVSWHYRRS